MGKRAPAYEAKQCIETGGWKAFVRGREQRPTFESKGAALAFAIPVSKGHRSSEPADPGVYRPEDAENDTDALCACMDVEGHAQDHGIQPQIVGSFSLIP